jgi:hypothetical protein
MVDTLLSSPFVKDLMLPFLLVFAIVFAVLQKAEIFGKDKKQTDAIIALVIGLLVVAVGTATHVITNLLPILAVGLVVLLAFFLLWGFAFKAGEFNVHKNVQWVIAILAALAVIIAVLYFTPAWGYIGNLVSGQGSTVLVNVVFVVLIIGAVIAVIYGGKKEEKP